MGLESRLTRLEEYVKEQRSWKERYEEQVEQNKKIGGAFKEAQEKIMALNAEKEKLTEKYSEIYKRVQSIEEATKELDEKAKQVEDANKRVAEMEKVVDVARRLQQSFVDLVMPELREKLEELLMAAPIPSTNVRLKPSKLIVEDTPSETVIQVDAGKDWEGKVLQVMVELGEAAKKGVAPSAIASKLTEKGWPRDVRDLAMNVLMGMVSKGLLVKTGSPKNPVYRLPLEVVFKL